MPTNYDTLTRSDSDKDERDEERGGLSAQALHGTVTHHAPLESIVSPPIYEQPTPIVRLPNLEGTLFDRSNLDAELEKLSKPAKAETDEDDEDDEESEDRPVRGRQRTPPPPPAPTPVPSQPPVESFHWPTEEDNKQAEEALQQLAEQPTAPPAEHVERPAPAAEAVAPTLEQFAWPEDDQDIAPVPQMPQPRSAHARPTPPPRPAAFMTEHFDTPPPPPGTPGTGTQPPVPPIGRPPESADFSYPNPNVPATPATAPNYNAYEQSGSIPAPRQEVQPQYDNNRAVDGFARLMGVGNFIGNHRTRKKLGKQIEQGQRETATNFADIQAQQLRASEQQRQQGQAIEQLRAVSPSEHAPLPAAPFAPPGREQAPATTPRVEYTQAPTYASQANPNMAPSLGAPRFAEQGRVMPPLPSIERRPGEHAPVLQASEQAPLNPDDLEPVKLEPGQHVEHSTWHDIVVDKHGNEVQGARHYGEGFKRSRREVIRDRAGDAAAAGTTAMAGIQQQQGYDPIVQYPGTLPSGMTTPTLPQGMPTHVDPQHQLAAQNRKSSKPGPIFWVMLVVIIAAFFAAALI